MIRRFALAASAALCLAASAGATPLKMQYCVTPLPTGGFEYEFRIILDNNDGSWVAGQGFGWFIFGDQQQAASPLDPFVGDPSSFPIGPFTAYQGSGGFHNGPTLGPVVQGPPNFPPNLWIPNAVGAFLTWKGTSPNNLAQGQMLWSNLMAGGGGNFANFVVATSVKCGGGGGCYANCDNSTVAPILNVNDFICFQNAFAAGDPSANCDGSTTPPVLNVNDFICFQNAFAAGCT
ncbi:MAG: GC-type dockerin domain-anchored protein [Phycisphaerales bacterium]